MFSSLEVCHEETQHPDAAHKQQRSKRCYFIRKPFQFITRYSIQVIQEAFPQNDNPQRICPRTWKTQAGAGRGLIKQKKRQFTKTGMGQAGGERTRSIPRNRAEKQCWKIRHEHNTAWQSERVPGRGLNRWASNRCAGSCLRAERRLTSTEKEQTR